MAKSLRKTQKKLNARRNAHAATKALNDGYDLTEYDLS